MALQQYRIAQSFLGTVFIEYNDVNGNIVRVLHDQNVEERGGTVKIRCVDTDTDTELFDVTVQNNAVGVPISNITGRSMVLITEDKHGTPLPEPRYIPPSNLNFECRWE
jgi:hypothetical protein